MRLAVVVCLVAVLAADAAAQDRRLSIRVEDPSGATIPDAQIIVLSDSTVIVEQRTDGRGLATINVHQVQQLKLIVSAAGFATTEVDVTIPARVTNHPITVSMPLATIETDVTVSASEEPAAGGSTEALSQAEIDQLPDDQDELQRALDDIAGPGATIRVDGFTGGRLPTRDQIARVVVRRDAYSAEFHQVGQGRVEITTRPGVDRWRGNAGINVRPSGLSATNAVASGAKAGTQVRMSALAAGPLVKNRVSVTADLEGSSSEDTRGISALTPNGPVVATLAQPFDRRDGSVRIEGLLTAHTMFRLSYSRETSERGNQGISELDFPERGYRREEGEHQARLGLEGGQRRPFYVRVQFNQSSGLVIPDTIAPAIVVQNAFRSGGASVTGDDHSRNVAAETMFTLKAKPYTLRVGSLMTWDSYEQGQLRNTLGTYTFTDLDSYTANRPSTFTQRLGAQPLSFAIGQAGTFAQVEFSKWRWNFGLGTRYEWQTGIDDAGAIAPRMGMSRGFRRNQTNVRLGYGWFYGWMPSRIEEETRRLAFGSTEQEVIIRNPSFPNPFLVGDASTRRDPPTTLALADGAELPRWQRVSAGLDHQIRPGLRVNTDVFYEHTSNDFRSTDLNAPEDGVRPDPAFGRVLLVDSIGQATRSGINVDVSYSPRQGFFNNVRYSYSRTRNDADDALTPPPLGVFVSEWAAARGDVPHRLTWNVGVPFARWGVTASMNGRLQSGTPYNVTTGRDDNGDALFSDRPAGTPRNSRRGAMTTQTDLRIAWTLPSQRPNNAIGFQRGPGGGPRGPGGGGRPGQRDQRRRFEMYLFVTNVFNRVNYSSYVGVITSTLFGQPTSAQAARRVEMGWRFSF